MNEKEFKEQWKEFKSKWSPTIKEFVKYFEDNWIKGDHNTWQIYQSPPGYAKTNSPIESFNAVIKRDFTKRRKRAVYGTLETIAKIIGYYSNNANEFSKNPKPAKKIIEIAELLKSSDFKLSIDKKVIKVATKNNKYTIDCKSKSCSCRNYAKNAICQHLIAANKFVSNNLVHDNYLGDSDEQFVQKTKRGAPKKTGKALKLD